MVRLPDTHGPARRAIPTILAIETSCDETAIAILRGRGDLLASEVASQIALHQPAGGVVPEAASREHLRELPALLAHALHAAAVALPEIDAFAATSGPGLASSLMIGAAAAKGLALGSGKPYLGINHLEGHLLSPFFGREEGIASSVGLIVSGGHTLLVTVNGFRRYKRLGGTRDDAAGEAFDKVAKLLGLPYPGGPEIDRLAASGDPRRFDFPRSMLHAEGYEFSFSGLKTAVRYRLSELGFPGAQTADPQLLADLCASFQEAVVDVLVGKTLQAARATRQRRVAVSGGVSLNSRLRIRFQTACAEEGFELLLAPPRLCTDNAAMIAAVAQHAYAAGCATPIEEDIDPNLRLIYDDSVTRAPDDKAPTSP
jgi:N6-L-threonylcarbamoyladenine synthase